MLSPISVTTLNNQIKSLLETHYLNILVEGEVSRVTYHSSGHLYFTLKDADSAISCVMFRGNNQRLKFRVEEGMQVIVGGGISVYTPRGSYQINCATMEPAGSGALALAYEQRKKELEAKGYFDAARKKAMPRYPRHIALVTSATGAALQDMLRVAQKRWPLLKITLFDTQVQGEGSAEMIARHIAAADRIGADLIVAGRGGGSIEDLWPFNEEIVAEAIFHAATPVVSAVGHEIDFLISDFVADLRAPTPSAAMELVLPDKTEVLMQLDGMVTQLQQRMRTLMAQKEREVLHLQQRFDQNALAARVDLHRREIENLRMQMTHYMQRRLQSASTAATELEATFARHRPDRRIAEQMEQIGQLRQELHHFMRFVLQRKQERLDALYRAFEQNDPAKRDRTGIAQISHDGKKIDLAALRPGDRFEAQTSRVAVTAQVLEKREL